MKRFVLVNEVIWLAFALLLAFAVCFPILYQADYAYFVYNALIICISFTYVRYIVTFKSLLFLKSKWIRVFWFIANILLFIFVLNRMENVVRWYDSFAFFEMFQNTALSVTQQKNIADYMFTEYVIFSIATFVGIVGYNMRMLASFWANSRVKSVKTINIDHAEV